LLSIQSSHYLGEKKSRNRLISLGLFLREGKQELARYLRVLQEKEIDRLAKQVIGHLTEGKGRTEEKESRFVVCWVRWASEVGGRTLKSNLNGADGKNHTIKGRVYKTAGVKPYGP